MPRGHQPTIIRGVIRWSNRPVYDGGMGGVYYILHGYNGYPEENWFPWLKAELEKRGDKVIIPLLPHADAPQLDDWLATLKTAIQENGEGTIIGHSLGGVLAMRYLEQGGHPEKIVLVATPFNKVASIPEIDKFFEPVWAISPEQIKSTPFVVIGSEDDPYVPIEYTKGWANYLGIEPILFKDRGHFGQKSFPEILNYL